MAPAEKKKGDITDREYHVLGLAWLCFKSPPEVDVDKLAKLAGYTNSKSVSNLLTSVKKKIAATLAAADGENGGEAPSTPAKRTPKAKAKSTPGSRKRKAPADDEDDSSDPVTPAPSKRARGRKATVSKAAVEDDDESDPDNKGTEGAQKKKNGLEVEQEADEDIVD
ncbi:hypothetical protein F5Y05DRAFT_77063 [Hypoxylon sp. FL0543]|nr:hypothetical protein F5Y05DRAFT_77063 [Hypoxylon sp. FL0543]